MSKDRLKNLIKLIVVCTLSVILTVVAVVFMVQDNAYAWFAKNNLVSANGINVAVKIDESVVGSAEYLNFTHKNEDNSYTFENNGKTEMQRYDNSEENVYQLVIKIKLTATTDSVTVYANTTAEKYLGANDADYLVGSDSETCNSMSSIVAFEIYYSDSDQSVITETISDGVPALVNLTPPDSATEYTFINENKTLSRSVLLGTHSFESSGNNAVYIVVKYNVDAINEVFSHNIGNSVCNAETVAFDLCDFSFSVS